MCEFDSASKKMIFSKLASWWLNHARYSDDIKALCPKLVAASLQVYNETLKALLPTPTRSHYTFNLRDLSRIFQGMQTAGSTLKDADSVVRLWVHETLRVCGDRLIDDHDRDWFAGTLKTATEDHFRIKWYGYILVRFLPCGCLTIRLLKLVAWLFTIWAVMLLGSV